MKTAFLFDMKMPGARQAADWLGKNGYQVDGAVTGKMTEEALQRLEKMTLDLLVICPDTDYKDCDGAVGTGRDYEKTAEFAAGRTAEISEVLERSIPALNRGCEKRIAFLTYACSSINWCTDRQDFAAHMLLGGLNMQAKLLFNRLRPLGFTMRCYALGENGAGFVLSGTEDREDGMISGVGKQRGTESGTGISPGEYIGLDFCFDPGEPAVHSEENRLVMRDRFFREIAW